MRYLSLPLILAATLILPLSASASGTYCVAVRGNGEYAAGHWGGMAKLIEEKGMPQTMMGGSSASISIFLMNGVAQNPSLKGASEEEKKRKAALLVKSIPAFLQRMAERDGILSLYAAMVGAAGNVNFNKDFVGSLKTLSYESYKAMEAAQQNPGDGTRNSAHFLTKFLPMLNPEMRAGLSDPRTFEVARTRLLESTAVFGAYKVDGDAHMFYRPGIVDFRYTALIMGTLADFYAGAGGEETNRKLDDFLTRCADSEKGKDWSAGACDKMFSSAVDSYLAGKSDIRSFPNKAAFENVGQAKGVESFVSTSTMQGESMERFKKLRSSYSSFDQSRVTQEHANFSVDYNKDLRFSYMGKSESLRQIEGGLGKRYPRDEKSSKFQSLGDVPWITAIAASAGEPGLTNFQPLLQLPNNDPEAARRLVFAELQRSPGQRWKSLQKDSEAKVINMGGWSDLHPTMALRAHPGCEKKEIVYLNRVGGETCFGQMLFVRVTGAQEQVPFWKDLCAKGNSYDWRQDPGFSVAKSSPWNRLYHSGNSSSSYNKAVHEADTVLCTEWDSLGSPFSGKPGTTIWNHFTHAYRSNLVTRAERGAEREVRPGCSSPLDRKSSAGETEEDAVDSAR